MNNNNENQCNDEKNCKNSSLSWTRKSSDPCALIERYARSEGTYVENNDINKYKHKAFCNANATVCDSNQLIQDQKDAMDERIVAENKLLNLNRLSSNCIKYKYKPNMEENNKLTDRQKLLINERISNCRIPNNTLYK